MAITGIQNGPASSTSGTPRRSASRRSSSAGASVQVPSESFQRSGVASKVPDLVDRLVTGPDLRVDLVEKFRALLTVGQLDTPAAAAKAAKGLLNPQP